MAQEITVDISYTILDTSEGLSSGILCAVSNPGHSMGDVIYPGDSHDDSWCLGAGICYGSDSSGRYSVRINGVEYKFNRTGKPASSEATGLQCYLVKSNKEPVGIGGVAGSMKDITVVRKEDGTVDYQTEQGVTSVVVNNLNARDQFALKVLQGFLSRIDNPDAISANEMSFYCDKAYEWASYLMTTAAMTRATIKSENQPESGERSINPDDLTSNTEILLNNLLLEFKKSELTEVEEDSEITSKLVTLRQFPSLIDAVSSLSTTVSSQTEELKRASDKQSSLLNALNDLLTNITVHVTYTE